MVLEAFDGIGRKQDELVPGVINICYKLNIYYIYIYIN